MGNIMMDAVKLGLGFSLVIVLLVAALIFYATRPAISPARLNLADILTYPDFLTAPAPSHRPPVITVATYNIGYAAGEKNNLPVPLTKDEVLTNLATMARALDALNLDIIGLQEVDFDSARTFHINQLDYLARALRMPYAAYVITWNKRYVAWPYWPPATQFGAIVSGQAVLSRYPITQQQLTRFEKPKRNAFWYNWFYLDRVIQELALTIGNDQPAALWHVHLDAFDTEARLTQASTLASIVNRNPAPFKWVIGDFNSVSEVRSDLSPEQAADLEDTGEALTIVTTRAALEHARGKSPIFTIPSWDPIKKIDHILYTGGLHSQEAHTIPGLLASDHLPVWARFTVSPSSKR